MADLEQFKEYWIKKAEKDEKLIEKYEKFAEEWFKSNLWNDTELAFKWYKNFSPDSNVSHTWETIFGFNNIQEARLWHYKDGKISGGLLFKEANVALAWKNRGTFTPEEAYNWSKYFKKNEIEEAELWKKAGWKDPKEAYNWSQHFNKNEIEEAKLWREAGWNNPKAAKTWGLRKHKITNRKLALKYKNKGLKASVSKEYINADVAVETAELYIKGKVDFSTAKLFIDKGIPVDLALKFIKLGLNEYDAMYFKKHKKNITDTKYVTTYKNSKNKTGTAINTNLKTFSRTYKNKKYGDIR